MKKRQRQQNKKIKQKNKNHQESFSSVSHESKEYDNNKRIRKQPLVPMNPKQESYIKAIQNFSVVVAIGSAGTSKSFIPSTIAADMFFEGAVDKIILTRPMEGPGRSIGTLPGDKNEKLQDWLAPLTSTIKPRLGAGEFDYHLKKGNIEFCPLNLIKGRNFDNSIIIADEAEDIDIESIKSLVTRVGKNTKLIITGDIKQQHIKQKSGLGYIIEVIRKYNLPIPIIEFTIDECVRSGVTRMFLEAFEKEADLEKS